MSPLIHTDEVISERKLGLIVALLTKIDNEQGEPREKPPDTPASRTWLISHVARAGLECSPDTAVR